VTAARRKADTELLTLTQAARRCGVSRSSLRRALDGGSLPGAVQSEDDRGTWLVPVQDLVAAGLLADPEQSADRSEQVADRSPDSPEQVTEQVTGTAEQSADSPEQVLPPGVGLVRWEDVQGLVGQLVTVQDDRARAETELRVATFRLEQAEAETERLRHELHELRAQSEQSEQSETVRRWWRRSDT
jgi:hypothetical protein